MLNISLSSLELTCLEQRIADEIAIRKPKNHLEKMLIALLIEIYQKLHNRSAFPKPFNRFSFSDAQAYAFSVYFKDVKHYGSLADNTIIQITLKIK